MKHVTTQSFEATVLSATQPVLVDFWADWCGPCLALAPVLEEVAEENAEQLLVVKVDVDANQELAATYNVRGIPTLVLFKDGEFVATLVGAVSKSELTAFLGKHL